MFKTTAIALAASLFVTSTALAQQAETQTRQVKTSDLNLASADGRATLTQRIKSAAKNICRDSGSMSVIYPSHERFCTLTAIDGTRPQVVRLLNRAGVEVAVLDSEPND